MHDYACSPIITDQTSNRTGPGVGFWARGLQLRVPQVGATPLSFDREPSLDSTNRRLCMAPHGAAMLLDELKGHVGNPMIFKVYGCDWMRTFKMLQLLLKNPFPAIFLRSCSQSLRLSEIATATNKPGLSAFVHHTEGIPRPSAGQS